MYLLDTNIVSELRKPKPHGAVLAWINSVPESSLFLSVVTLGEIQAGIEITRQQDSAKAIAIETWLDLVAESYNVISIDGEIFREWAKMMHRQSNTVYEDAMIAACARIRNLTVVTRNVRDFKRFKVEIYNPFNFSF